MDCELLSDQDLVNYINTIISTLEYFDQRFYVAMDCAYQLRDELLDIVDMEE